MARLYANENFPLPVVEELRRIGHDVVTIQETGGAGQAMADEDVLAYAVHDARAVMTLNRRHFVDLHRRSPDHAGIVVCTFDLNFVSQAHRIDAAIASEPDLVRKLIRVNRQ